MALTLHSESLSFQLIRFLRYLLQSPLSILIFATTIIMTSMSEQYYFQLILGIPYDPYSLTGVFFKIAFEFFLWVPVTLLYTRFILQKPHQLFGLRKPENLRLAIILTLITMIAITPIATYSAHNPVMRASYTFHDIPLQKFIFIQVLILPIYYFCEEFFFRGFLFLSLWRRLGWHSFWITDFLFTYSHFGKPPLEILLCIPASVMFNYLTLRTRSILPAYLVHGCFGISLNILVNYF